MIRRPADMQQHERECDPGPLFRGAGYSPDLDRARLQRDYDFVLALCRDGAWRTKGEIHDEVARTFGRLVSEESIGRYLRYCRDRGWELLRRRRGAGKAGLWEYRLERGA